MRASGSKLIVQKDRRGPGAAMIAAAVGHNFRRILAWLRDFWRLILTALIAAISVQSASDQLLNGRLMRVSITISLPSSRERCGSKSRRVCSISQCQDASYCWNS
jgi:hypothetical protein